MKVRVPRSLVRRVGIPLVSAIASSWRMRSRDEAHRTMLVDAGQPFVFLVWHEVLLPLLWYHRHQGIAIVVSEAREGRYLGDLASRIGYRLLPGSSTRGGARALLGAVRVLHEGSPVAFTPDGPRGPRRDVKPGVVSAAQRAGVPVLPVHAVVSSAWRLRSWDRMVIPKPFARIDVRYGAPFAVGPGPAGLTQGVERCAVALDALEAELLG